VLYKTLAHKGKENIIQNLFLLFALYIPEFLIFAARSAVKCGTRMVR
jgi:hypothetical protein